MEQNTINRAIYDKYIAPTKSKSRRFSGMNEEIFLEPLYERAKNLSNPAKDMLDGLKRDIPLEHYINEYSLLQR